MLILLGLKKKKMQVGASSCVFTLLVFCSALCFRNMEILPLIGIQALNNNGLAQTSRLKDSVILKTKRLHWDSAVRLL